MNVHVHVSSLVCTVHVYTLLNISLCLSISNSDSDSGLASESLDGESFEWLTKDQAYILVYLVRLFCMYATCNVCS